MDAWAFVMDCANCDAFGGYVQHFEVVCSS